MSFCIVLNLIPISTIFTGFDPTGKPIKQITLHASQQPFKLYEMYA